MLSLRVVGMAEVAKTLRVLDKELLNAARKDLRTGARPLADAVKAGIPSEVPMSGMLNNGKLGFSPGAVKVTVRTNFTKSAERNNRPLVAIVAGTKGKQTFGGANFQIIDQAGRKKRGKTASGRNMIRVLNEKHGRASRIVYPSIEPKLPQVEKTLRDTIKKLGRDYTNRLKG